MQFAQNHQPIVLFASAFNSAAQYRPLSGISLIFGLISSRALTLLVIRRSMCGVATPALAFAYSTHDEIALTQAKRSGLHEKLHPIPVQLLALDQRNTHSGW
jgi:hypothetical protein